MCTTMPGAPACRFPVDRPAQLSPARSCIGAPGIPIPSVDRPAQLSPARACTGTAAAVASAAAAKCYGSSATVSTANGIIPLLPLMLLLILPALLQLLLAVPAGTRLGESLWPVAASSAFSRGQAQRFRYLVPDVGHDLGLHVELLRGLHCQARTYVRTVRTYQNQSRVLLRG